VYTARYRPASGGDFLYIGYGNTDANFNEGKGTETRHTLGTCFFGLSGAWKWDLDGHVQFGNFAGGDIRACSVATEILLRTLEGHNIVQASHYLPPAR
jgi:hypothetical protein